MEADRLRQYAERAASAHLELARHRETRLANENRALSLESLHGNDLLARELYRKWSLLQESRLIRICHEADRELETQRSDALSARRKVMLVEKLRDRKRDEFNYLANRDLEQIAADSWLAGFARNLTENGQEPNR
jgi:DNA polymerase III delta prime subunit